MNNNIFDETILSEVMNFKGEIIPIPVQEKLLGEKEVGNMTNLERVLNTLYVLKIKEGEEWISKFCGLDLSMLIEANAEEYFKLVNEKATEADLRKMCKITEDGEFFREFMWLLIHNRIPEYNDLTFSLRPDFKIVVGRSKKDILKVIPGFGLSFLSFRV